jgi:hypothetical protein
MHTFLSQWREKQRQKKLVEPQAAPHNGVSTSMRAAESMYDLGGRLRFEVYSFIAQCGWVGATCDEIEQALNMKHQTASARVNELMNGGHIHNSGRKRSTSSGRAAIVWVRADAP